MLTRPSHRTHDTQSCACHSRRSMLRGIAAAAGVGLLLPRVAFAGNAEAVVLTCMDYRLVDDAVNYFNGRGLKNNYDQLVLAGASLGALGKLGPDWASTFWKHVDTSIQLHHVHELVVVDHRDCGAYKLAFGAEATADRADETALHRSYLRNLREQVATKYPELRMQLLLMDLDGSVEDLSADEPVADVYRRAPKKAHAEAKPVDAHVTH
jgi:Putative carbonic anhydrase